MRFVVNSVCSLCFVVFEIFPVRCFGLRSLRIHEGVFRIYIYIRYIYIYIYLVFVCDVSRPVLLHMSLSFCDACPLVF